MSLFGTTFRQVASDLDILQQDLQRDERRAPDRFDHLDDSEREWLRLRRRRVRPETLRAFMQILVSLIVLNGGLYVLVHGDKGAGQAAAGIMGIVVGYWLR
jgi:ABC-type transport system involved in cytochrome bd biosynthesis fused ATPase/permease subunit